jgi:hypothetical protein
MKKRIKHRSNGDFEVEIERCTLCNEDVDGPASLGVDYRPDYIAGAGGLCRKCNLNRHEPL